MLMLLLLAAMATAASWHQLLSWTPSCWQRWLQQHSRDIPSEYMGPEPLLTDSERYVSLIVVSRDAAGDARSSGSSSGSRRRRL